MVYVVMTAPVRYNGSNEYRRIVVAEMNPPAQPRIIHEWPRLYAGKSPRCAFRKTIREAIEISDALDAAVRSGHLQRQALQEKADD